MGVLEEILNNNFSINYYGLNDMATGWHVNTLIENEDSLIRYYESIDHHIKTKDDFRDYLTLETIIKYQETIEHLKNEDLKTKLSKIIDFSKKTLGFYKDATGQIYELLNSNFSDFFEEENDKIYKHDFYEIILEYAFRQHNRLGREVFSYIENEQWSYIINHFDICRNYYKNHVGELDSVIERLIQAEGMHPYSNIDIFLLENKSPTFENIFNKHAMSLAERALTLLKEINEDNYIEIRSFSDNIISLASLYRLGKQLKEFDKLKPSILKASEEYFKKHGTVIKREISSKEILDKLSADLFKRKIPANIVFLELTHSKSEHGFGFEPTINSVLNFPKSMILDSIHHIGIETNARFSASVQMHLRFFLEFSNHLLSHIIQSNEISEVFYSTSIKVLEFVSEKYNLEIEELRDELNGIIDSIVYLISIDDTYPFYRTFCFGLSQTICSFIEKILRKVDLVDSDDEVLYKSEANVTLGYLLSSASAKKILGNELALILMFELLYISEQKNGINKRIGSNIRNRLMHNSDISYRNEVHIGLVVHLFYILIVIIHQLEMTKLESSSD